MLRTTRTLLPILLAVRDVLRRSYGWRWPVALARCVLGARRLVRTTRWAIRKDEEARLVSALAIFPAIVLDARRHLGADAANVAGRLVRAALDAQSLRIATDLASTGGARERWHAFADRAVLQGLGAFNETECLSVDGDRFHLRVHRCLYADLARDTGVPELAQALCDLGAAACGRLLASHEFHRNGPAQHTLAYGHAQCDYVWQARMPLESGRRAVEPGPGAPTAVHGPLASEGGATPAEGCST